MRSPEFVMYGLDNSWYSAKLRPYLHFKGIAFRERKPSALTWYYTIRRRFGNPTIPVLVTPEGQWLQDTSVIIDHMEQRYPDYGVLPREPVQRLIAYLVELWADEFWHATGVYWRWKYPENYPIWEQEVARAFLPGLPFPVQRRVARLAAGQMAAHLPKLGATAEQIPLLERWSEGLLEALDAHFALQPFLLGTQPSLGDFALMGPLWGHLGYDPGTRRHHIETRTQLLAWMQRMNTLQPHRGEFLDQDALPPTLAPLLHSVFDEMLPYLGELARLVRQKLPSLRPGERLPRLIGQVEYPLCDGRYRREGTPYTLWMLQRIRDALAAMSAPDERRALDWLSAQGGEGLMRLEIPRLRQVGLQAAAEWPRRGS